MTLARIRTGDTVQVMAGREKGKTGKVLEILIERERALIEGLNRVKRHLRPKSQKEQGGILEKEAPVHLSNLQVVCTKCGKATRIAHKVLASGQKARVCKKCGEILDKEK